MRSGVQLQRATLVLGASGSVGSALVARLTDLRLQAALVTFVRRSQPQQVDQAQRAGVQLTQIVLRQMDPAGLQAAVLAAGRALPAGAVGISALGVGAGTGRMSVEAHRAVDLRLNAAFARGLKEAGCAQHLVLMSAAGANPAASAAGWGAAGMARYARVKGEAEEAAKSSGLAIVSILRPALIVGSRHTPRALAAMAPALDLLLPHKYKSIHVDSIVEAMVALAASPPVASAVYHRSEMMAMSNAGG